jgi:phenylacetate-CoA ligase
MLDGTYYDGELETTPWEQIQQVTFAKAQAQIERAYEKSSYYRRKYDKAGVKPSDIRTPADLARVPFFEKVEERTSQQEDPPLGGHLCVEPAEVARVHASSGTTGAPTFFAMTANDLRTWDVIMGRAFYTMGMRPSDIYGLLGNLSMFVGGVPALTAAESIGATVVPIGATAGTQRTLELVRMLGVTMIGLTPSFAVYLGEQVESLIGCTARELNIRRMMVGGEPGGQIPAVRQQITDIWGCEVRDLMGIGEVAGACWAESDDLAGMHWCGLAEVHLELIDGETGEPLPWEDGVVGEIFYTAVEREATPLIRFRSHDHVLVRMGGTPSGRTAPRVTPLGRTDDMLLVRGINVFPSAVRDVVASFLPEMTGHIRIVLERPGPLVTTPLIVEAEISGAVADAETEALRQRVAGAIKSRLNFTPDLRLVPDGSLPRTTLKTQYIHKAYEQA